jgi:hypothetical protein
MLLVTSAVTCKLEPPYTVPYKLGIQFPKTIVNVQAKRKHEDKNL